MAKALFSIILLLIVIDQYSCRPKDEYRERVEGVIRYLHKEHNYSNKKCTSVYLLEVKKCNVCTLENLHKMQSEKSYQNMVFILSDFNDSVFSFVNRTFAYKEIFIDSNRVLPKYGLSFMRNLKADICNNELKTYQFY
jgi:hypothetical protein